MSASAPTVPPTSPIVVLRRVLREQSMVVLVLLLLALVGVITVIRPGTITLTWASNVLLFAVPLGLMAGGETLLLLTGGIDLSVAAVATGSGYLLAATGLLHPGAAVFVALAVGLVVGVLNGVGVGLLNVQPLVMTLGTGLMTTGALVVYSQRIIGQQPHVPEFIVVLGSGKIFHGLLPVDLFLWLPVAAGLLWGLRRTGYGRLLYAVGDNPTACRLAGVRVWQVLLLAYVLCGLLAAAAGLVLVGTIDAADLSLANPYLLPAIAAAIIGGTSIFGGRGGYGGTIVGALILTVLDGLLTLLNAPEPVRQILYGAIILGLAAAYTRLTD
jgi:ribose transport system permease protein